MVGKPIYPLVWIYGLYLACTPLLLRIGRGDDWRIVFTLLDKLPCRRW